MDMGICDIDFLTSSIAKFKIYKFWIVLMRPKFHSKISKSLEAKAKANKIQQNESILPWNIAKCHEIS
jgi:hypothetical protein